MESAQLQLLGFSDQPMDVALSSEHPLVAVGLVDGTLSISRRLETSDPSRGHGGGDGRAGAGPAGRMLSLPEGSSRAVAFASGSTVAAGGRDGVLRLFDAETGKEVASAVGAHEAAITRLCQIGSATSAGAPTLASGDEAGVVRLWDPRAWPSGGSADGPSAPPRTSKPVASLGLHTDYVSDLVDCRFDGCLASTSGDGTLSIIDWRASKEKALAEGDRDDELLSVAVLPRGHRVVCGTTSGAIQTWGWGRFGLDGVSSHGHPESVDALAAIDDDTLVSGSSDGLLRLFTVQPDRLLGVLGNHGDFPIERLAITDDRRVLASASHDGVVKLWDLSELLDGEGSGGDGAERASAEEGTDELVDGRGEGSEAGEEEGRKARALAGEAASGSDGDEGDGTSSDSDSDSGLGSGSGSGGRPTGERPAGVSGRKRPAPSSGSDSGGGEGGSGDGSGSSDSGSDSDSSGSDSDAPKLTGRQRRMMEKREKKQAKVAEAKAKKPSIFGDFFADLV